MVQRHTEALCEGKNCSVFDGENICQDCFEAGRDPYKSCDVCEVKGCYGCIVEHCDECKVLVCMGKCKGIWIACPPQDKRIARDKSIDAEISHYESELKEDVDRLNEFIDSTKTAELKEVLKEWVAKRSTKEGIKTGLQFDRDLKAGVSRAGVSRKRRDYHDPYDSDYY